MDFEIHRFKWKVDAGAEYPYVHRHPLGDRNSAIDTRRHANIVAYVVDVQRQMAADQAANFVTVVKALDCIDGAENEQTAKDEENRQQAE